MAYLCKMITFNNTFGCDLKGTKAYLGHTRSLAFEKFSILMNLLF